MTALAAAPDHIAGLGNMVPAPVFARVPVHGREILAVRAGDAIRVPMKAFCGAIGLPWEAQRKRLQRDELLAEAASIMEVPSGRGLQLQVTLPAELIAGFLFGCEVSRLAPELRDRIALFRRECFAVLHAHFFARLNELTERTLPPRGGAAETRAALHRANAAIVTALVAADGEGARRHLHALLTLNCAELDLPVPPLAAFGLEPPSLDALFDQLIEATAVLDARSRRGRWNHAARPGELALDLLTLAHLLAQNDVDFDVAPLRAALDRGSSARWRVTRRTITSAITAKPVFAWLLEAWR